MEDATNAYGTFFWQSRSKYAPRKPSNLPDSNTSGRKTTSQVPSCTLG